MANEVTILVRAKDEASKVFSSVTTGAQGMAKAVGVASVAGAAAVGAFGIASVGMAANFEHAISAVGAVANASEDDLKGLADTGLRIGKETAFSAGEAASAMETLAANGLTAKQIMEGAADAAVNLAAAGGTDLRTAADVASTAMTVWGIKTGEMTEVVNRLAGAANVSRFGVEDMAGAIAQGGGAAKTAGVEFADFTAAVAAIAPSFSSGSDAGTSLKTMLVSLTGNSNAAKNMMRELGIITEEGANRFFDAQGNVKSMADVTQVLHDATKDLSEAEKTRALSTIFGTDAMRAAAAIANLTGDEFSELSDTMKNTDAAEVARRRMDNAKGAIEALKGSLEVISIEFGMRFTPAVKQAAQFLADALPRAVDRVGAEFAKIQPDLERFGRFVAEEIVPAIQAALPVLREFAEDVIGALAVTIRDDLLPKLQEVASIFEEHFLPVLQGVGGFVVDTLVPALQDLTSWLSDHKEIVVAAVAAYLTFEAGLLAVKAVGMAQTVIGMTQAFIAMSQAQGVATAATTLFNLTLAANPIVLVIAAVAALVAGLIILYKNWDTVTAAVKSFGSTVMDTLSSLMGWLEEMFFAFLDSKFAWLALLLGPAGALVAVYKFRDEIIGAFQSVKDRSGEIWSGIASFISGAWSSIQRTTRGAINSLIDGMNSFIRGINNIEINFGGASIPFGPDIPAFSIGMPDIPQIPRLATGGIGNGFAWVGENGPELVHFGRPGRVFNAGESRQMAAGAAAAPAIVHLHFHGPVGDRQAAEQWVIKGLEAARRSGYQVA